MKLEIIQQADIYKNTNNNINNNAKNTHILALIQEQIQAKRKLLLKKQKELKKKENQNEFLSQIRNDYAKYYDFIIEQKRQQMESMQMLQRYIDDIIISEKLTDQDLMNAKKEQEYIVNQLKTVKYNLDEIVSTIK